MLQSYQVPVPGYDLMLIKQSKIIVNRKQKLNHLKICTIKKLCTIKKRTELIEDTLKRTTTESN
jgi:hypothetical protein